MFVFATRQILHSQFNKHSPTKVLYVYTTCIKTHGLFLPCQAHPPPICLLYTPYISRGFYFREFRESSAIREFNNTRK